jgi:hypothetical protein
VSLSFVFSLVILLWFSLASIKPLDSDCKVALTGPSFQFRIFETIPDEFTHLPGSEAGYQPLSIHPASSGKQQQG